MITAIAALLRELLVNLWAGLRLSLFLPLRAASFRASAGAFVLLAAFNVLVWFATDFSHVGWPGRLHYASLQTHLAQLALVLLGAFLIAQIYRDPGLTLRLAVMWLSAEWVFELVASAIGLIGQWAQWTGESRWVSDRIYWVWVLGIVVRAIMVAADWRRVRVLPAAALACGLYVLIVNTMPRPELWRALPQPPVARMPGIEREATFHGQANVLEQALAQVHPGRAGVIDLYFLGVAAYGSQDVFLRELRTVRNLFDDRFDTAGRSVALINNNATLADTPIATVTNLRAALRHLSERMNRDEDILFLFMTTHGDEKHQLMFDLSPLVLDPITPPVLAQALRESAIKWKVLVISACYSGGFVEALKDADTVVITAADAHSTSFGCAHENEWTYFGEAYFNEGLRKTRSFVEAFDLARERVAVREQAEGLTPSNPQIHVGESIRHRLHALEGRLSPAPR